MTLNEWILLIAIALIIFFVSEIVRKKLKAGTKIILSLISFIILMTVFIMNGVTHRFTWIRIIVLSFFALLWVVSFYYQVKKYQHTNKREE
jgi:Ca2+/Na+ antiporter